MKLAHKIIFVYFGMLAQQAFADEYLIPQTDINGKTHYLLVRYGTLNNGWQFISGKPFGKPVDVTSYDSHKRDAAISEQELRQLALKTTGDSNFNTYSLMPTRINRILQPLGLVVRHVSVPYSESTRANTYYVNNVGKNKNSAVLDFAWISTHDLFRASQGAHFERNAVGLAPETINVLKAIAPYYNN